MLSMKAKYALRALGQLGTRGEGRCTARQLAADASVPEKFLESILVELRDAGFVRSRRGAEGGHALARAPESIVLGDVIRAIDGPLAPIRCASLTAYRPCEDCPDPGRCSVRRLMSEVRQAIAGVLDHRTLRDQLDLDARRAPDSAADAA